MSEGVAGHRHTVVNDIRQEGLWDPVGLELPKNAAWVGVARLAAAGIGYRAGMSFDAIEDIKVIVAEALSHCIQHGRPGGRLRISFEANADSLAVTVNDPSFPVAPSPPKDRNGSSYRAFVDGLFLIRGLADEVDYVVSPSEGLTLRIRRAIS
ncbi:MAG: ATP-binding protein [Candidatus Eremiobacteraeota bacterium]|nr:ATP-binding protein [Candidatus Eremiobacteraeota bacterium]